MFYFIGYLLYLKKRQKRTQFIALGFHETTSTPEFLRIIYFASKWQHLSVTLVVRDPQVHVCQYSRHMSATLSRPILLYTFYRCFFPFVDSRKETRRIFQDASTVYKKVSLQVEKEFQRRDREVNISSNQRRNVLCRYSFALHLRFPFYLRKICICKNSAPFSINSRSIVYDEILSSKIISKIVKSTIF